MGPLAAACGGRLHGADTEGLSWHQQHAPRPCQKRGPPLDAARAGAGSAGGPRCRADAPEGPNLRGSRAEYSRRAAASARRRCPAARRLERPTRRLPTPAQLPESGSDAPPGAFDAAGLSSDGALAASGGDERAVETLSPPPPPPQERRAAVGRSLHGRVALSTAGRKSVGADLFLTARSQGHNSTGRWKKNTARGTDSTARCCFAAPKRRPIYRLRRQSRGARILCTHRLSKLCRRHHLRNGAWILHGLRVRCDAGT